jgi:hypothetical protein
VHPSLSLESRTYYMGIGNFLRRPQGRCRGVNRDGIFRGSPNPSLYSCASSQDPLGYQHPYIQVPSQPMVSLGASVQGVSYIPRMPRDISDYLSPCSCASSACVQGFWVSWKSGWEPLNYRGSVAGLHEGGSRQRQMLGLTLREM